MRAQILSHLHLKVRNAQRSARFYRDAFGLEEAFSVDDGAIVFLRIPGGGLLTLNQDPGWTGVRDGVDHFGFAFDAGHDRDQAIADAVRAGGTVVDSGEHRPGIPYAYVADPDGYRIEL